MSQVDLSGVEIVDAHTHPYRLEDLVGEGVRGLRHADDVPRASRSSRPPAMHDELWPVADGFTDSTVFAIALRRWLAAHLGCEPTREAVTAAREAAIRGGRGRVHERAPRCGRGRGRRPLGRGVPAAADPRGRVRRDDRRDGPPRDPPRAVDPPASGRHRSTTSSPASRTKRPRPPPTRTASRTSRSSPTGRASTSATRRRRRPGRVRSLAWRRLGRDEGAREAGPRLPDPPDARGREGERPAVPLPLRRRRPGHQPRVRGPGVDVPPPRRRPGSADRPGALRATRGSARPRTSRRSSRTSTWSSPS